MQPPTGLSPLLILCVCARVMVTEGFGLFPGRNDLKPIRKSNCTTCNDMLALKVAELPRLSLIRQRILVAVGRVADTDMDSRKPEPSSRKQPATTASPRTRDYYKYKIISPAITPSEQGDIFLQFRLDASSFNITEEAVGASLLLFVDRRRKIRKGGKGKKIFIEVSKLDSDTQTWSALTHIRTTVKKRRLKRISLPVYVARQLIHSDSRSLDLKVKCEGCGRLVNIVLQKNSERFRRRRRTKGRKRKRPSRRKNNPSAPPELIIRTRYRL